ncbi:uncharacterized protein L201_007974 [Kwoniella dendrophila CBS 6074]|uniref:Uncharacterized protein n=1 Tax=Kwoniella dendrophila CBS 6074 TaxID=1295534 RepID=A0AAX4K614_9TREE
MSSVAGPSTSAAAADTLAILPQLLDLLQSPLISNVPSSTLLGAISHFLSQLESPHLEEFISTFLSSRFLWSYDSDEIRNAIRLSVPAKIAKINEDTKDVYFINSRRKRKAREWLNACLKLSAEKKKKIREATLQYHMGLLQGISDIQDIDWGKGRNDLEEMIVLALAEQLDDLTSPDINSICSVIPNIDSDMLQVLDLQKLTSHIETTLYGTLDSFNTQSQQNASNYSRALARSIQVLRSGGPSSQEHARAKMLEFSEEMQKRGEALEEKWESKPRSQLDVDGPMWNKHKLTFSAFLTVASSVLDTILLENASGPDQSPSESDIILQLLVTLGSFSYLIEASQGGFENYHKILYGSLDLISARAGPEGVKTLLSRLTTAEDELNGARAGYALVLAEELINYLDRANIDRLLQLAERCIFQPNHKSSFEASHAFFLALLRISTDNLETDNSQSAFYDALLPNYLNILIRQYSQKHISPEQFRQAFPMIVESASKRSSESLRLCLDRLSSLPPNKEMRQIRITITPYINTPDLPQYLENLAQIILETDKHSEERTDLMKSAFEMVVRDLSDSNKHLGIKWWLKYRRDFEDDEREIGFVRSRL